MNEFLSDPRLLPVAYDLLCRAKAGGDVGGLPPFLAQALPAFTAGGSAPISLYGTVTPVRPTVPKPLRSLAAGDYVIDPLLDLGIPYEGEVGQLAFDEGNDLVVVAFGTPGMASHQEDDPTAVKFGNLTTRTYRGLGGSVPVLDVNFAGRRPDPICKQMMKLTETGEAWLALAATRMNLAASHVPARPQGAIESVPSPAPDVAPPADVSGLELGAFTFPMARVVLAQPESFVPADAIVAPVVTAEPPVVAPVVDAVAVPIAVGPQPETAEVAVGAAAGVGAEPVADVPAVVAAESKPAAPDLYAALLTAAKSLDLRLNELKIAEAVAERRGELTLKGLAVMCEWGTPDGNWGSAQTALNGKLLPYGIKLQRHNNRIRAVAAAPKPAAKRRKRV